MSSIQERLQLKRIPLDTWNVREQLCLASAVARSGDQNWMSVSRALKTACDPSRPADWYSQKSCAAQYGVLLENVETPKRKKRNSEGAVETPQESILKKLTQDRIAEIQGAIADLNQQYQGLKSEIAEIRNPATPDDRVRGLWSEVERAREREQARRAAWLREREERRARAQRPWRATTPTCPAPTTPTTPTGTAVAPSSPLLTSLLKSSPVTTTPQHISHPANVVETLSPSAGAPTLSMLLEKPAGSTHEHAAIEHIKSQLVQIERQYNASTSVSPSTVGLVSSPVVVGPPLSDHAAPPIPLATDKVDIDDIEIKAEDVYAFSDIDFEIAPVSSMHKAVAVKPFEKSVLVKKEDIELAVDSSDNSNIPLDQQVAELQEPAHETLTGIERIETTTTPEIEPPAAVAVPIQPSSPERIASLDISITFPEVKFPTPEIKVIPPEEQQVKEETRKDEHVVEVQKELIEDTSDLVPVPLPPEEAKPPTPIEEPTQEVVQGPPDDDDDEQRNSPKLEPPPTELIPLPPGEPSAPHEPETDAAPSTEQTGDAVQQESTDTETTTEAEDTEKEPAEEQEQKTEEPLPEDEVVDVKKEIFEDAAPKEKEDGADVKCEGEAGDAVTSEVASDVITVKEEAPATEEANTDTDDDTPMELIREEEKDGKKKRDYSRKKKPDSRTCSGSESAAEASAPESPMASGVAHAPGGGHSDAEREHRLWKKSVMLVYNRLCAHKYASLFLRPITDEQAPDYSAAVKRPMDLGTIKRNIDSGHIRSTAQFQRDVLLMLANALMYNCSSHRVHHMAHEMHQEAESQLGMLLAAQAHAGLSEAPARRSPYKRRAQPTPQATKRRHD